MAKVTFDNVPDSSVAYLTQLGNDYLNAVTEAQNLDTLRKASKQVKDQVHAILSAEKASIDAAKAAAEPAVEQLQK